MIYTKFTESEIMIIGNNNMIIEVENIIYW